MFDYGGENLYYDWDCKERKWESEREKERKKGRKKERMKKERQK